MTEINSVDLGDLPLCYDVAILLDVFSFGSTEALNLGKNTMRLAISVVYVFDTVWQTSSFAHLALSKLAQINAT